MMWDLIVGYGYAVLVFVAVLFAIEIRADECKGRLPDRHWRHIIR